MTKWMLMPRPRMIRIGSYIKVTATNFAKIPVGSFGFVTGFDGGLYTIDCKTHCGDVLRRKVELAPIPMRLFLKEITE
jgi:hypothetical protein